MADGAREAREHAQAFADAKPGFVTAGERQLARDVLSLAAALAEAERERDAVTAAAFASVTAVEKELAEAEQRAEMEADNAVAFHHDAVNARIERGALAARLRDTEEARDELEALAWAAVDAWMLRADQLDPAMDALRDCIKDKPEGKVAARLRDIEEARDKAERAVQELRRHFACEELAAIDRVLAAGGDTTPRKDGRGSSEDPPP